MTFFLLYVTEGLPQGFAAVAIAYQLRNEGRGPAEVGAFVASLYFPWAWKVVVGPIVDLVYSDRLGKRRGWIVFCQLMMAATLLLAWKVDYSVDLRLFSLIIIIHNIFAATQDVAIDALAVSTLPESERGVANGFMFAGAYSGAGIGGAGVIWLSSYIGFSNSFWLVAGSILVITVLISMRIREPRVRRAAEEPHPEVSQAAPNRDVAGTATTVQYSVRPPGVRGYAITLLRSMFGNRRALAAFAFALLPSGAFAISLTVAQSLYAEFALPKARIANLVLLGTVLSAAGSLCGGFISDRLGRRKSIAAFVVLTLVPTAVLAWYLERYGWVMPVDTKAASRPVAPPALVTGFIIWALIYAFVIGLIYGSRTAGFMDISDPVVAGTQFTAYMSLMNLALSYSSLWQGWAAERFGYPTMLLADGTLGLLCLVPLALMAPNRETTPPAGFEVQRPATAAGSP